MATLEISYWAGTAQQGGNVPGRILASEAVTLSGSSAQSGVAPAGADLVSILATGTPARFEIGANPTAGAASAYLAANERIWMTAQPGARIAGISA